MMKSIIPLQQNAYRLTDLTLPHFFHFRFELFIESTNFNQNASALAADSEILGGNQGPVLFDEEEVNCTGESSSH